MINILFVRSLKANLPEIEAYLNYFNNLKGFFATEVTDLNGINLDDYDVTWEFMGKGLVKSKRIFKIHEYVSLSTGKYPKVKNYLKKKFNIKPDLRIFLNKTVQSELNFNDKIPFALRDMGVSKNFFEKNLNYDEFNIRLPYSHYDFVYSGAMSEGRNFSQFLRTFSEKENGKLLLIGSYSKNLYDEFKNNRNITFLGKVEYKYIPYLLKKAEYGINFIPDIYPLNVQTSTKLLEYMASGLKIITTNYEWVRNFEKSSNSAFYKLPFNSFNFSEIKNFNYLTNLKSTNFLWDNIIKNSGIAEQIISGLSNKKK